MSILFKSGGALTTVQDLGRQGWQQYGVPLAGAVDQRSLRLANVLVGNPESEAGIETTFIGPIIEFREGNVFAVTGGDLGAELNGRPIERYKAIAAHKGDVLSFRGMKDNGSRAYIAFAGGLAITPVMGSKSTYLRSSFGGLDGRKLRTGDEIKFQAPVANLPDLDSRRTEPETFPAGEVTVRAVRGPQSSAFTERGIKTFFTSAYRITNEFDRMGVRLEGEKVEHVKDGNMISDGIVSGSVQIPTNGLPIIMLSDHQTTGGYTKIVTVVSVDIPLIAQSRPGCTVRFKEVDVTTAQQLFIDEKNYVERCRASFGKRPPTDKARTLSIRVNGKQYMVQIEEII
ncbi:MAG: biotin-dependent carboxyltransferase family protein [Synergistaceae bacterium]|nr:biotin-dependent carboxyltransferase family protein [Synergistaceae bacterium]